MQSIHDLIPEFNYEEVVRHLAGSFITRPSEYSKSILLYEPSFTPALLKSIKEAEDRIEIDNIHCVVESTSLLYGTFSILVGLLIGKFKQGSNGKLWIRLDYFPTYNTDELTIPGLNDEYTIKYECGSIKGEVHVSNS